MHKTFILFTEVLGWIRIVCSPLFLGLFLGVLVYLDKPSDLRLGIGLSLTFLGLFVGIIWATRVWRRSGTMSFLSRITATPELDKHENEQGEEKHGT